MKVRCASSNSTCLWSGWAEWGPCSLSCNKGVQVRINLAAIFIVIIIIIIIVNIIIVFLHLLRCGREKSYRAMWAVVHQEVRRRGAAMKGNALATAGVIIAIAIVVNVVIIELKQYFCRWGPWGTWDPCSVTCGQGRQK